MAETFFDKIYKNKTLHTPDVLSCLANLSNDEVFTPPDIANKMLDLLPQELFKDPNTTFLDPACKTGVFLREIAKRLIKGLAPLGKEYQALLKRGHDERWIDVEETEGKRSGAYSTGTYGLHPYVLLNYQQSTHDVFTIAHEMGHSLHTYYSNANQPYAKADYRIFVAEVASTVNEVLLQKYILSQTKDVNMKKYLLNYFLDTVRTTLHRQTMFAEFEYLAHTAVEKGTPLTTDYCNEMYLGLNKKYYGDSIVHDEEIAYEWSRIPHFYNSFYVYKYATGIISAISIVNRILTEGEAAVRDYKKFLSSGGSDSPVELLKLAGVDLTKRDAFRTAMQAFRTTLDELETLTK